MSIKWKGKLSSFEELPKAELSENAVKFKEPSSLVMLNIVALLFSIPVILLVILCIQIKFSWGKPLYDLVSKQGVIAALLMIIPHEMLHAIAFPKGSDIDIWYSPKHLVAFVHSISPTSKSRFIFISLLPNLVFGLLPFILWLFMPNHVNELSNFIFTFSLISLLSGAGDYMNVFNAATQMPGKAWTRLSGFHSYWYYPEVQSPSPEERSHGA